MSRFFMVHCVLLPHAVIKIIFDMPLRNYSLTAVIIQVKSTTLSHLW